MKQLVKIYSCIERYDSGAGPTKALLLFVQLLTAALWRSIFISWKRGFDAAWYRETYPDINGNRVFALLHYSLFGWKEQRNPTAAFNVRWYLDKYRDVQKTGMEPYYHYLVWGWKEERNPSPIFDAVVYKARFMDRAGAKGNPLLHFQRSGRVGDQAFCRTPNIGEILSPALHCGVKSVPKRSVDVIVPVYSGVEDTQRLHRECLKSSSEGSISTCIDQ